MHNRRRRAYQPPKPSSSPQWYLLEGYQYSEIFNRRKNPHPNVELNIQFLDEAAGVVWRDALVPWKLCSYDYSGKEEYQSFVPYYLRQFDEPKGVGEAVALSPRFGGLLNGEISCRRGNSDVVIKSFTAVLDPEDLERIKQVRFHFAEEKPAE